jgi:YfiH family protein
LRHVTEPFITSSLLLVPHGFSTRHGGVSEGPYRSLNLGFQVGDERSRVEENVRRLAKAAGFSPSELHTVSQVHGDRVLEAKPGAIQGGEGDALWTGCEGAAVGIRTADCVPILLADPDGRRVAAVHSGWRGADLRIAHRAVEALVAQGARADRLIAAVGPAIQVCCYAVSDDLAARFRERFGDDVVARDDAQWHLDLARVVRKTLEAAGLRSERIDVLLECTSCDSDLYFSHRRDKGLTGRHLSFAVCRF